MAEKELKTGFAPNDYKDNRELRDWKTKYPEKRAQVWILIEGIYIIFLLFIIPMLMVLFWSGLPQRWIGATDEIKYKIFLKFFLVWLGGTLGGTLFDLKWLYHSVAKQIWNRDRLLWRLCSPHLSGGIAFVLYVVMSSSILKIFDLNTLNSYCCCVAIGALTGYFSDMATAKLSEVAETLFGITKKNDKKNKDPDIP